MARITRNRQDPASKVQTKSTRSATSNVIADKAIKEKSSKAKASTKEALIQDENAVSSRKGKTNVRTNIKNALVQDENAVPTIKGKNSNAKSSIKKGRFQDENASPITNKNKANTKPSQSKTSVLGSKLQPTRKNNSSGRRSSLLALKSPVLRDRTNTSNNDTSTKKDVQLIENKKITRTNIVKKSSKKNSKNEGELQESIKKYFVKQPVIKNKQVVQESTTNSKGSVPKLIGNKNNQGQVDSATSLKLNTAKARKKSNLSIEAVEELLNQEDKIKETEDKELNKNNSEENVAMKAGDADIKDNKKENKITTKKFFKNKIEIKSISVNLLNRKNPKRLATGRNKVTAVKKVINRDSTFSPKIKEQRKSTKPAQKKLRTRAVKNYCEVSKVSQDCKSEKKQTVKNALASEDDKKGVPIYKTIELSQESNKDKKEIYEFPDDSQESGRKVKKQKRTVKKPTVKRARKAAVLHVTEPQKLKKKKPDGKVPNKVQFKDQEEQPRKDLQQGSKNNCYANIEIPEDLQNAGDSTIAEASTIKVISDKRLEGSERINLMMTPSAPKTINSELKLFGPTNAITSQPKVQYSNMVNHSLIRHSMSPIIKEIDNFDVGSPWRPIDAFSRVKKVVQSTPQINRVLAGREKKPLIQMNLNKKSIGSEDTIHLSSIGNEKLTKQNVGDKSPIQPENVSPRKFGTVISNINSSETTTTTPIKQTSLHSKAQSPLKAVLPPTSPPTVDNESQVQDNITPISTTLNKTENSFLSPNKSPKKKIQTPSPFRFDRMRTYKKTVAVVPKPSTQDIQKENKDPNAIAGPSDSEKSKAVILRQSNLNNFLNLDEMPESSRISTRHGIFDDIHSTPITGKKPQKIVEPNIENAFGFDEDDFSEEISDIKQTSGPLIATAKDVAKSVKGKLFPNARVKSRRISENIAKKTLLQNVMKKSIPLPTAPENKEISEKNDENKENDKSLKDLENNNNEPLDPKKILLEAVSFSDTFDVLSENGEDLSSKVPDEIPLFVDLEPVHFQQPPRRSYNKRKKAVCFNTSRDDPENDEDDDYEKPKKKRKKESRLSKEEQKRLQDWVKNINESFKEIEHFDLLVE